MAFSQGIPLKKQYGQHFLRQQSVVEHILEQVKLTDQSSVFEIGCGDGFLTQEILKHPLARLWVFEIDPQWADYVRKALPDKRMHMKLANILEVNFQEFEPFKPWVLLANLPYQITFPILHLLQQHRDVLKEGVIMVQEEVAQKIVKTSGRGYGFPSLFFQHFFEWKLLQKVPPSAFHPAPSVDSRLLYFKPKAHITLIPDEENFWRFIKVCFRQPRRTLKNNLATTHYDSKAINEKTLALRAQQMSMDDFLKLWQLFVR